MCGPVGCSSRSAAVDKQIERIKISNFRQSYILKLNTGIRSGFEYSRSRTAKKTRVCNHTQTSSCPRSRPTCRPRQLSHAGPPSCAACRWSSSRQAGLLNNTPSSLLEHRQAVSVCRCGGSRARRLWHWSARRSSLYTRLHKGRVKRLARGRNLWHLRLARRRRRTSPMRRKSSRLARFVSQRFHLLKHFGKGHYFVYTSDLCVCLTRSREMPDPPAERLKKIQALKSH